MRRFQPFARPRWNPWSDLEPPLAGVTEQRQGRVGIGAGSVGTEIKLELIVILSDINMPGMHGLTLLGEVKKRFPDLPVMMITAYGDGERRRRADDLGAADFLTKPVDFVQLKAQLRQLPTAAD
jgi:CheY-like chemotaxis protein